MYANEKTTTVADHHAIVYHLNEMVDLPKISLIDLSANMAEELLAITKQDPKTAPIPLNIVYYPWLNTYYKILNESDFVLVRTSRNKNKITEEEASILQTKRIGIIGQSTGSQLAYLLAQERICGQLILADADTISLSNLNRIHAGINQIGMLKTVAIARAIAEMDPYFKVSLFNEPVTVENRNHWQPIFSEVDLLVDACDNMRTKVMLRLFAKEFKIPILMETNDKGRIDIERYDLEERPIFHGAWNGIDEAQLLALSPEDLSRQLLMMFNQTGGLSQRMMAALPLIGKSLLSYPQLASETVSGAATLATCIRAIFLEESQSSGVFFVDLANSISAFEQNGGAL